MNALPVALLGFAAGATALQWQAVLPGPWWWRTGVASLVLVWAWAWRRGRLFIGPATPGAWRIGLRGAFCVLAVFVAATFGGFGYAGWRAELRLADALPPAWEGRDIAVIGVIDDLPAVATRGTRFALAVERVRTPGAHVPARLSLVWYPPTQDASASAVVPTLRAGERWQMLLRLKRPHGSVNPHGFDLEAWLLDNAFRATGYVRVDAGNRRLTEFAGRATDVVQRTRENVRERALRALGTAPYAGVIVALAIGEQRAIPEAQWRVFNRTGITHLISISGMHVTAFAALAAALAHAVVRRFPAITTRLPAHRIAALFGALAAFFYVLLAGAQVPAQRTLIMLAVAAAGVWLARPGTARMVWLWALALVLAWDPWAGLAPGFWLSFGAVGLLLYSGTGRLHSAPLSRTGALRRSLRAVTHAQFVVTVGLVPLTLAVFQQISLIAPLANALAIPVVTFGVVPLALAAIVIPVDAMWQLAHAVFAMLMMPLDWLAVLPAGVWQQHAPAPWTIVASFVGVLWLLAPRGIPLRALGFAWLLPLFVVRPLPPAYGKVSMTVLDVGQGLAVVVQTHAHALLYDTGPRYSDDADAGGRIVAPFLRAAGIGRLSTLVISHQDSDHSGGASTLLRTVAVDRVLSSLPSDNPLLTQPAPSRQERCRAGQAWSWDGVRFSMLHPAAESYRAARMKTNDLSCVVRIDAEGASVLLTGDIEARSEEAILRGAASARVDVLVVPHHGSRTSSTPAFIAAVQPRLAIFTPGYRNRFGHPRADVVERYRASGATLARTDLQGAITVAFDQSGVVHSVAERDRHRRYWYDAPIDDAAPSQAVQATDEVAPAR